MKPIRFESYLRPMVWGGRRLGEALNKPLPDERAYGESWEISDHPLHISTVAAGPFAGATLRQIMADHRVDLLGSAAADCGSFPWLVKFLDCNDWLSVQVHPDENAVKTLLPGEGSKTEAWFLLDAAPGSVIYAGLNDGIDEQSLRAALGRNEVTGCLHRFSPKPGDCVFLPAGTLHAVGGGVLMAEIQQTSDATFRLYDWDRKDAEGRTRPLHIEEALASVHWDQGPVRPIRPFDYAEFASKPKGGQNRTNLVRCPHFQLEYAEFAESMTLPAGFMQVLIVIRGEFCMKTASAEETAETGQVWLIPAACERIECTPHAESAVVLCSLPE